MLTEIIKYLGLYLLACLKSIFPPLLGPAAGLRPLEIIIITLAGLMTSVAVFSFLGDKIRTRVVPYFVKNPKKFTPRSRRMVSIWRKYGIAGVCFLTPLILSPPGGAFLVSAVGAPKGKVFLYMLLSGIFWSVFWTYSIVWITETGILSLD